jgi:hypothetical protein
VKCYLNTESKAVEMLLMVKMYEDNDEKRHYSDWKSKNCDRFPFCQSAKRYRILKRY